MLPPKATPTDGEESSKPSVKRQLTYEAQCQSSSDSSIDECSVQTDSAIGLDSSVGQPSPAHERSNGPVPGSGHTRSGSLLDRQSFDFSDEYFLNDFEDDSGR